MSEKQLEARLRTWQGRLGLGHWDVSVDFGEAAPEGSYAAVRRSDTYDRATLLLEPGWGKWSAAEAEKHVVHELLHLFFRDIDEACKAHVKQLHPDAAALAEARYEHAMEGCLDRIAVRIVALATGG